MSGTFGRGQRPGRDPAVFPAWRCAMGGTGLHAAIKPRQGCGLIRSVVAFLERQEGSREKAGNVRTTHETHLFGQAYSLSRGVRRDDLFILCGGFDMSRFSFACVSAAALCLFSGLASGQTLGWLPMADLPPTAWELAGDQIPPAASNFLEWDPDGSGPLDPRLVALGVLNSTYTGGRYAMQLTNLGWTGLNSDIPYSMPSNAPLIACLYKSPLMISRMSFGVRAAAHSGAMTVLDGMHSRMFQGCVVCASETLTAQAALSKRVCLLADRVASFNGTG